jgi:hypothetical protein
LGSKSIDYGPAFLLQTSSIAADQLFELTARAFRRSGIEGRGRIIFELELNPFGFLVAA